MTQALTPSPTQRESLRDPPRVSIPFGKEEPTDYHFIPTDWLRCWATGESPPGYKPSNPPANSKVIDVDTEASSSTEAKAAEDPAPANLPGTSKCNNLQLCCQEHALALHPKQLHKFKILSSETYKNLKRAVDEETGDPNFEDFEINNSNFRCLPCETR